MQFGRLTERDELEAGDLALAILVPRQLVDLDVFNKPRLLAREFGIPEHLAERRLAQLMKLPENRARRKQVVTDLLRSKEEFDTGDYEAAFRAMSRNAEKR